MASPARQKGYAKTMVVLVKQGSASASRSWPVPFRLGRAMVVGNQTFGKRISQTIIPLGGSGLRTDHGENSRRRVARSTGKGITPDSRGDPKER